MKAFCSKRSAKRGRLPTTRLIARYRATAYPGKFREIWFASGWTVAFFDPSFRFFNSFNHITPWQN